MSRHLRNTLIPTVFVAVLAASAPVWAQNGQGNTSTGGTKPPATASGTQGTGSSSGQTVFRPKETIAPGKPVSFPADI